MRTNLAEINQTVSDLIANENLAPKIAVHQTHQRIAGFLVPDEHARNVALAERRGKVATYQTNADQLTNTLRGRGVEPLAVVPTVVWDRICKESRLYRFDPSADGRVRINTSILKVIQVCALIESVALWTTPFAILLYVAMGVRWQHPSITNCGIAAALVALGVIYLVASSINPINPFIAVDGWLARQTSRILNWLPHSLLMRCFFPARSEAEFHERGDDTYATLALPTPPADVADVLLRVKGMGLKLALVPAGFQFVETPADLLRGRIEELTKQRLVAWQTRPADPIVYMQSGNATAIVAQFGDFPIEREVVDRVCQKVDFLTLV